MNMHQVKRTIYRQYTNLKKGYEQIVKPELLPEEIGVEKPVYVYEDTYELSTQQRMKWRSKGY